MAQASRGSNPIRYAVVGLGHIAQAAVLPAFKHARNSKLSALVSGSDQKLKILSEKYKTSSWSYQRYEDCLNSGQIDAVYICLPNDMHQEYAIRAAKARVHVLSEKPLGVNRKQCEEMIKAAKINRIKLMTAYRLHFEETNLKAIEIILSGKIGEPRYFNSSFSFQVTDPDNIRLKAKRGGGTIYDIGIYCLNAARYVFQGEPTEVFAYSVSKSDRRFREVDEMTAAVFRFPSFSDKIL